MAVGVEDSVQLSVGMWVVVQLTTFSTGVSYTCEISKHMIIGIYPSFKIRKLVIT